MVYVGGPVYWGNLQISDGSAREFKQEARTQSQVYVWEWTKTTNMDAIYGKV